MFFFASTPFQSKSVPPRGCTGGRREVRAVGSLFTDFERELVNLSSGRPRRARTARRKDSALPRHPSGRNLWRGRGVSPNALSSPQICALGVADTRGRCAPRS
jgi:hypothetical protein